MNLYNIASTVIPLQTMDYYQYKGRGLNDVGLDITEYEAPITIRASIQAIPRNIYDQYGLDLQKNYVMIYSNQNFLDIGRDVSGDQVVFDGKTYQDLSLTDWYTQAGWVSVRGVQVDR